MRTTGAEAIVEQVRRFIADPDLDRYLRVEDPERVLYLSHDPARPTVPRLALCGDLDPGAITEAEAVLAADPTVVLHHHADRFSVVLEGEQYAGLLAAEALGCIQAHLVEARSWLRLVEAVADQYEKLRGTLPGAERYVVGTEAALDALTPLLPPTLWAVHVNGPDDILAMPDRETADRKAAEINAFWAAYQQRPDARPDVDPTMSAEVIEWDGTAEEHAAYLAELLADGEYLP